MDADVLDWDTHFVPGLLAPAHGEVALVKGFYERPLRAADGSEAALDGGRVTELVGRPLIALDWPELGWLVQPMAGEWAVRRDLLARLWVPTGYAVELAALVDTLRLLGPDAIAQVDLGRRAHRHQALRDLGAMAVQIIAASDRRARGVYPGEGVRQVGLHQHRVEGRTVVTEVRGIELTERPPSVEVRPVVGGSAP